MLWNGNLKPVYSLLAGGLNTLAILGGIIFVLIAVIILSIVVCFSKNRARYYTREDHLNGSEYSYEIAKYLTVLITQKNATEQDKKPTQTETSKTNGPAPRNPFGPDAKCKQNRPKDKALK